MGYVTLENDYWVIDQNCKLLKKIDQTELKSLIRIDGLVPVEPEEGSIMTVAEEDGAKLRFLSEILNQMLKRGLWTDVSIIDMSDVTNPAFAYLSPSRLPSLRAERPSASLLHLAQHIVVCPFKQEGRLRFCSR